jgi:segregation and condensation protein A
MEENTQPLGGATTYHIKTEHFQGPLDLLLSLIEKRKLFISDFSLARVADEYIAYIRRFDAYPVNDVANFLLIASTLVLIKSKSILPQLSLTSEETSDIDDLKKRIALFEMFRELSTGIKDMFGRHMIFERSGRTDIGVVYAFDPRLTSSLLAEAADRVILQLPKKDVLPTVTVKKVISLEEMIARLTKRVTAALKTGFGGFSGYQKGLAIPREKKIEVVVAFLAMLELVKQGIVHVTQREDFGEIDIEAHSFDTPSYG